MRCHMKLFTLPLDLERAKQLKMATKEVDVWDNPSKTDERALGIGIRSSIWEIGP